MDFIHDFDSDIEYVLEECEKRILAYPANIKDHGYKYLEKLHLLKNKNHSGGFCYLMPFWLTDTFKVERNYCRTVAIANTFCLLYFMSQDQVMDNLSDESNVLTLPLSSLFFTDLISTYCSLFPWDSNFWSHFNTHLNEWSQSVVWERENHWYKAADYSESDLILLARKAAPMKSAFAAICILSGQPRAIDAFSKMFDYDQVAYQMIDDWRDWKEDLKRRSYTYLLVQVMKYCNLSDPADLNETHVKKAIFMGDVGEKMLEMAKSFNKLSVDCVSEINSPYLNTYLALEKSLCDKVLARIQEEKEMMLKGGLDSLLWSITKK